MIFDAPVTAPFPPGEVPTSSTASLGVCFAWYDPRGAPPAPWEEEPGQWFLQGFKGVVADALRRQKRARLEFWDGLTYIERAGIPPHLADLPESRALLHMISALRHGRPNDEAVRGLVRLVVIECARSSLEYYKEGSIFSSRGFTPRTGPAFYPWLPKDPALRQGFHRVLKVDMRALGIERATLDPTHLVVLALLVQIHAELEVFYETRFWRIRKCARAACGAWFCAKRMDSRSKFCSTACRVGNARESVRSSRARKVKAKV